ncbi:hypothetical protein CRYUN_Cryun12cG0103700 [Craigia yunnanensis]
MGAFFLSSAVIILLIAFFISTPSVLALVGALTMVLIIFTALFLFLHVTELISKDKRPPVAGLMLHQLVHFNRLFDYLTSLAKKQSTYRLIMPLHSNIYTADPVNIEYILRTNFPNYGRDNAAKLVSKVSIIAVAKHAMNLQDMFMKSTLDSIFKVGFGVELNALSGSDEFGNRFTKAFDDSNVIVYWRYVDVFWKVKRFLNIGLEAALKRNVKIIDDFIFELIQCKREQMKNEKLVREKEDILSRFLMESEWDPENMTDQYLRDIILNFMIAGKDTTANTLTWFFYMLCKHPLVQGKVVQEVIEATQAEDNICADEFSRLMTEEALDRMQYLHAALTETLRLYPAVPVDGKCSEEDDVLPDGFKVKKGDGISYMAYAMGRMTYIWGEDADEYRPERWLDNGIFRPDSPFKFTAFQAGPRICLGKEFAYRQMKILAAVLLYFFQFRLVDETMEATYRTMFTLHMAEGLNVYAFPRA